MSQTFTVNETSYRVPIVRNRKKKLSGLPSNSSLAWISFTSRYVSPTTTNSRPSFKPISGDPYCSESFSNALCCPPHFAASFLRNSVLPTNGQNHGGPELWKYSDQKSRWEDLKFLLTRRKVVRSWSLVETQKDNQRKSSSDKKACNWIHREVFTIASLNYSECMKLIIKAC